MVLKRHQFLLIVIIFIISLISALMAVNGLEQISFWLTFFILVFAILVAKDVTGNYTNIVVLFVCFHLLYNISGPFLMLYSEGLHSLFTKPYEIVEYLLAVDLSVIGLWVGIIIALVFIPGMSISVNKSLVNADRLYNISLIFSCCASLAETINLIRVGGTDLLFAGKAIYQSLTSSLVLTLPSGSLALMAFCLLAITISHTKRIQVRKLFLFVVVITPYLLSQILLGKRGILLSIFLVLLIGVKWYNPVSKVNTKLISVLLITYILLASLYAWRPLIPLLYSGETTIFVESAFEKERMLSALIPGNNEFGAAFGNFSEYYKFNRDPFHFGETYLRGMTIIIPSWLYPGTKPKTITYEFRDRFFPSEAQRGAIAGTGFSGLLESYMNFGLIGPFLIYSTIGFLLICMEIKRKTSRSCYYGCFYLFVLPNLSQSFHRSEFGDAVFSTFFIAVIYVLMIYILNIGVQTIKNIKLDVLLSNKCLSEQNATNLTDS